MTSILPPHPMYTSGVVQFKDPFRSKDTLPAHHFRQSKAGWDNDLHRIQPGRTITPPPEMSCQSQALRPAYQPQEHGHHYSAFIPTQPGFKAQTNPPPASMTDATYARNGYTSHTSSRTMSPVAHGRQRPTESLSRRGSQQSAIAAQYQIPRSVNDSGGSLSELAAQITCLFWFESSDLLQQVEDAHLHTLPVRQLALDAIPTTGFRKWVTTILSTTLVAQNVVLLALLFIYRLKKLNPGVKGKPGSEYRLLTVALMLGNKFLDDNTYTNKTWAEVSGINVGEVHIMEVEFLSNMKYCLFTSAEEWKQWQTLLGKYADFFDRATRPQPAPILPPASSLHLPAALPSPPASNQASPPWASEAGYGSSHGPTPAPSPLVVMPNGQSSQQASRKRSLDDPSSEPPAKRIAASGQPQYLSPRHQAISQRSQLQSVSRLTLPSLQIPPAQQSGGNAQLPQQGQQLPPMNVPSRSMAMVYPNENKAPPQPMMPAGPASQPVSQVHSQYQSRQQSPYPASAAASPTNPVPQSATSMPPQTQISPSYFLQQRNSPYRPVHNVSTLLYPPPSAALHQRAQKVELNQMHYQPLGRPAQRQSGHLPYVSQNVWLDGQHQQQHMTPVHQWPGFMARQQRQNVLPQPPHN